MKILTSLILFCLSCTTAFAATGDTLETPVSDTNYIYYYGQGCAYCANVDYYLKRVDAESKIDIEKREIYFNEDNRARMAADAERVGLNPESVGVPFLILEEGDNVSHLIGDAPIIEYFTPILGEAPKSNRPLIALVVLGLLIAGVAGGLIFGNKKS